MIILSFRKVSFAWKYTVGRKDFAMEITVRNWLLFTKVTVRDYLLPLVHQNCRCSSFPVTVNEEAE